jgi:predicted nuclease of predicted toxin-antitoxin system
MRLLLDENIPLVVADALSGAGFAVRRVSDFAARAPDDDVLAAASSAAEILVTADTDFGELVWRRAQAFHGVVLIRMHPVSRNVDRIVRVRVEHRDALAGAFVVVSAQRVRVRRRGGAGG